jgi:predicted TIM-barrel fold metal-dependent hydrolase
MRVIILLTALFFSDILFAQQKNVQQLKKKPPIIDVHLHALKADDQGPPPVAFCLPVTDLPVSDPAKEYGPQFLDWINRKDCKIRILSPVTDTGLMTRTIEVMKRNNVFGVVSGSQTERWVQYAPDRFIPGLRFRLDAQTPSVDSIRTIFKKGFYKVLGEVGIQYEGYEANDPLFEPYLALMEELDIPVAIHIGTGPPGAPYLGNQKYRARMHSPLALEEVLIKHPRLRISIMHAGWPMIDDLLAVLWTHPQVYIDVGAISFALPRKEFHKYLQRIVEAGFAKRVMFGSDQMIWPETIEYAIESIETASFLSAPQKRDIFFNNAARFLRLRDEQIKSMQN